MVYSRTLREPYRKQVPQYLYRDRIPAFRAEKLPLFRKTQRLR